MANWKNKINITKVVQDDDCDGEVAGKYVADKLTAIQPNLQFGMEAETSVKEGIREELDDLISQFRDCCPDQEEFNHLLERLYDLGDTKLDHRFGGRKFLWIETTTEEPCETPAKENVESPAS